MYGKTNIKRLEFFFTQASFPKVRGLTIMVDESEQFFECEEYIETALSLSLTGKNEEALKVIDKAIKIKPDFAQAYNKKGDFLFKLGRIKEALDCYLKSKELNKDNQNNYYDLGRTYLMLGDYNNSLENFKIANQMKAQTDIHAFIGKIYFEQGNFKDAKASFENVLREDDHHMMSVYYYALILMQEGNPAQAKGYFNKVIEKYARLVRSKKNFAEGYYYLGKCYFYLEDYEKAEENMKLAIQYDTDSVDNHYSFDMFYSDAEAFAALAEIQTKLGETAEAKENILKALSLEPNNKKLEDLKVKLGF